MVWEAVERLSALRPVQGATVIVVALAGVVVNGASALLLRRGSDGDLNRHGAVLHLVADAAVSFAVVLTGALLIFSG